MKCPALLVVAALAGLGASEVPAAAQSVDDGTSWGWTWLHEYGGDVNRPGATADRPYWHGDDAIPLYQRYHDPAETVVTDEYGMPLPPPPETEAVVVVPAPRRIVHNVHRRRVRTRIAKRICTCAAKPK